MKIGKIGRSSLVYIKENPKEFLTSERFLSREELKEKFGSGKIYLRHDYEKSNFAKHKKKKKKSAESGSYLKRRTPRSRILRIIDL